MSSTLPSCCLVNSYMNTPYLTAAYVSKTIPQSKKVARVPKKMAYAHVARATYKPPVFPIVNTSCIFASGPHPHHSNMQFT